MSHDCVVACVQSDAFCSRVKPKIVFLQFIELILNQVVTEFTVYDFMCFFLDNSAFAIQAFKSG